MRAVGLRYVRFGYEEKNLFRFLFQTNQFGGMELAALFDDPQLSGLLGLMAAEHGIGAEEAKERFLTSFALVHGLASLLANNAMEYDEERCARVLENVSGSERASRKGQEHV